MDARRAASISIPARKVAVQGDLSAGPGTDGLVIFAHGSGSGRHSPRNRFVAKVLQEAGLGTLLIDLLTSEEEEQEQFTAHLRFDMDLLSQRLIAVSDWMSS